MVFSDFQGVEILRAIDGDTVVAHIPGVPEIFEKLNIRLKGIDAAELRGERACEKNDAERGKAMMANLVTGRTVDLHFCTPDKYFRAVCVIFVDGVDVSAYMIDHGYAVPYAGDTKIKWKCTNGKRLER